MKKITLLVLLVSLLMPMTMNATVTKIQKGHITAVKDKSQAEKFIYRDCGKMPIPVEANVATLKAITPKEDGTYLWDFEDADAALTPFTADDKDGDGFNWTYYNNASLTNGFMTAHQPDDFDATQYSNASEYPSTGLIASASYDNDNGAVLNPDNWLVSPELTLGGVLSFYAMGQDPDWCEEVFGVYVIIDGVSTQVGVDKTATEAYVKYEYDLSPYAGQTGKFAIVHHNVSNMFFLNIDDIEFNPAAVVTPDPTIPTNVEAEPTATTAEITWTPGDNNASWDLRYRPYTDPALLPQVWNCDNDYFDNLSIWDFDEDGYNWGMANYDSTQGAVFYSQSWISSTYSQSGTAEVLTPDNWLIFEGPLGGTFKFNAWTNGFGETFGVYIYPGSLDDMTSVDELTQVGTDVETTDTNPVLYTYDLSGYEGDGTIIIRHYNCTDGYYFFVDDVELIPANAAEEAEWIVKENVTSPYVIEGLTPETEYEVQVMAYNEAGDKETDWTKSTNFVTLAAEQFAPLYILGEVNGKTWAANDGVPMTTTDGQVYTANITIDKSSNGIRPMVDDVDGIKYGYFSFTTELAENNDDGGWAYIAPYRIGAVSEAGADNPSADFRVYKYMFGQELSLTEGDHAFQLEEGTYNLEVDLENMKLVIDGQTKTAITDINVDRKADNSWYNLAGQKLSGKPSAAGIYINNGKKVVIK